MNLTHYHCGQYGEVGDFVILVNDDPKRDFYRLIA